MWLPSYAKLASDDKFERTQYAPPGYLMTKESAGAVISATVYAQLASQIEGLPSQADLPALTANEIIASIQIVAPLQVLGTFPQPARLNGEIIVAVADGDIATEIQAVNLFIQSVTDHPTPLTIMPSQLASPVEFYLDGPGFPAWHDFARLGNKLGISLAPLGVLVPEEVP